MKFATLILFGGLVIGCATQPLPGGPSPDLAGGDMAYPSPDLAAGDMAYPAPDLAAPVDLAQGPDLAQGADLSQPPPPPPPPKPACGTSFSASGTVVASVSTSGEQEALLGASASGDSLLLLRAGAGICMSSLTRLTIADAATSGTTNYVSQDITLALKDAGFLAQEETMTLTADGLGIIGVSADAQPRLLATSRSAVGAVDFGAVSADLFVNINATMSGVSSVQWPVISADGLALYYRVTSSSGALPVGIYESLRASTSVAFPAGTLMPAAVQQWSGVSAISSDRLTLFVTLNFGTSVMTRASIDAPFAVPAAQQAPGQAYRIVPVDGCRKLVGTCEPGGCQNEDVCLWNATP